MESKTSGPPDCRSCPIENCRVKKWMNLNFEPQTREERFEIAKTFVESGLSVVPIPFGTKSPKIRWKEFQLRLPTEDELRRWFLEQDNTIGIVTGKISGLVVIDLDSDEAIAWAKENLPFTSVRVKTSRGQHWYYTYPQIASAIKNKVKVTVDGLFLDLDVRADGGLVLGPGAIHPDGSYYKLMRHNDV